MKKKFSALAAAVAVAAIAFALALGGCSSPTSATLDSVMPWNMPTLYEHLEYKTEKYLMKVEDGVLVKDTLLAEGSLTFTLEEADGGAKLTMRAEITYNDNVNNGVDAGKSDSAESEVVFSKTNLLPVSSKKTVMQDTRPGKENNSYETSVSYADNTATFKWLRRNTEPQENTIGASGQVFDNEQLFFAVRAFTGISSQSSQSFLLYTPADAFIYNRYGIRSMTVNVASDKSKISLDKYVGAKEYGLERNEGGYLETECYPASISLDAEKSGPPITVYYSSQPFVISPNISTYKVPVRIVEAYYGEALDYTVNTFYSLSDYTASF